MPSEEHLRLLQQGAEAWNQWPEQHPATIPDLTDANLTEIDLNRTNLAGANLRSANFKNADIREVNFGDALLMLDSRKSALVRYALSKFAKQIFAPRKIAFRSTIFRVNLERATLSGADLTGSNIAKSNLANSNLIGANLDGANLAESNFAGAILGPSAGRTVQLSSSCNVTGISVIPGNNLSGMALHGAQFRGVNLRGVKITRADLTRADLSGADLSRTDLRETNFSKANFAGANLDGSNLSGANFSEGVLRMANLSGANLNGADLTRGSLVKTNLAGATMTDCMVFGISAWDANVHGRQQTNLNISDREQPVITVDNLEVAQFIYLLLNNKKIGQVINTITTKAVLILGRFAPERKPVLDAIREELRTLGYLPILFDFDPAASQSRMQTVSTLAHLARFVIADITDAKTVLQELQGIVPGSPTLPVQPLLLSGQKEPGMFDFFRLYPWFLRTVYYDSPNTLLENLRERVIEPAEGRALEIVHRLDEIRRNP